MNLGPLSPQLQAMLHPVAPRGVQRRALPSPLGFSGRATSVMVRPSTSEDGFGDRDGIILPLLPGSLEALRGLIAQAGPLKAPGHYSLFGFVSVDFQVEEEESEINRLHGYLLRIASWVRNWDGTLTGAGLVANPHVPGALRRDFTVTARQGGSLARNLTHLLGRPQRFIRIIGPCYPETTLLLEWPGRETVQLTITAGSDGSSALPFPDNPASLRELRVELAESSQIAGFITHFHAALGVRQALTWVEADAS